MKINIPTVVKLINVFGLCGILMSILSFGLLLGPEGHCSPKLIGLRTEYSDFELKPGDMLFQDVDCGDFCQSIEKVTSGFRGAKFSHVGMIVPHDSNSLAVIEAVSKGVVVTSLNSFFERSFDANNKSKVVVGRVKSNHEHWIPEAIAYAKSLIGASYDEEFDISNDKYYCSELLYESFKAANNGIDVFELKPMTYKDPDTGEIFPIWLEYFNDLELNVPEGKPGLNPGGMSMSPYIEIVHFYGRPRGYEGALEGFNGHH